MTSIFNLNQKELLVEKINRLMSPVSFDGIYITIGQQQFKLPSDNKNETVFERTTLAR